MRQREALVLVLAVLALMFVPGLAEISAEIARQLFAFTVAHVHVSADNPLLLAAGAVVLLGAVSMMHRRRW